MAISPMQKVSSMVSSKLGDMLDNMKAWGDVFYNVQNYGIYPDGTDVTNKLQALINLANSEGRTAIFFPHGDYYVTYINNDENIYFFGDNARFIGGYSRKIYQIGSAPTLNIYVNVKDYGAKGDGVTNDSTAIQAAIDTGMPVFVPEGNFFIGDKGLNNVSVLLGVGKGRSVITINGSTTTALKVNSENAIIRDIEIDHTGTPTSGAAISIYTGSYSTIENVYIRNTYHGITFQNSQSVKVYNIEMWGFIGYGLYFNGLNNDIFVSDAFINGQTESSQPGPGHGIRIVDKGEALTFHNVEVILCDYAMSTDSANNSQGNRPAYCKFTDCFFDSSTNGVLLDKIVSFKFISCWFSNRPSNGCVVINSEDILFSGSDFVNNGGHGCLVQNTSKRIKFLGCDFIANSSSDPGMYHGLIIAGGTTDFVINECTATNGMGFSGTQSWGIFVANGSSDRYIIKNNLVTGNVSGGVSDNGTGTNKSIENNY